LSPQALTLPPDVDGCEALTLTVKLTLRAIVSLARGAGRLAALASACACAALPSVAHASTAGTIHPSFLPNRLGASTAFTLALRFSGGEEGVPTPLSGMVVRLPVGLVIDLRGVAKCPTSRLQSRGAAGCPRGSLLGRGHALLEVHAGSLTVPEESTISVFRGPDRGASPTIKIFGHGETPLDESSISTAILRADNGPYGSRLTVSVPPIPTLVLEPDASFSSLSVTIGAVGPGARTHAGGDVVVPRRCPSGGFPFAASFTFADQSTASAVARAPCP
jgi:hypothetical protein